LLFVKRQNVNNDEQYNTNIFNHFNNNYNIKQQQQQHKSSLSSQFSGSTRILQNSM
ncbi:unnamed protein product, partial [Rotaria sordida]